MDDPIIGLSSHQSTVGMYERRIWWVLHRPTREGSSTHGMGLPWVDDKDTIYPGISIERYYILMDLIDSCIIQYGIIER